MNWILSGNINKYDVISRLDEFSYVYWNQTRNYEIGDFVYIYLSGPIQEIRYKCRVTMIDLLNEECENDSRFWVSTDAFEKTENNRSVRLDLIGHAQIGMSREEMTSQRILSRIQGPIRISDEIADYIDEKYFEDVIDIIYPDEMTADELLSEGHHKSTIVNKYERNIRARQKCLDVHGYDCKVCNFNFQEFYGDIGRDFIHVHHLTPISEIKDEYIIDPVNDLIPVCPNCHAMLHRTNGKGLMSVAHLRKTLTTPVGSNSQL